MSELTPAQERETLERLDFMERVKLGTTIEVAALTVGWGRTTLKRQMRDAGFVEALEAAQDERDGKIVQVAYDRAANGDKEMVKFWLTNKRPEDWADRKQVQIGGEVQVPIHVTVSVREGLKELLGSNPAAARQLGPGGVIDVDEVIVLDD